MRSAARVAAFGGMRSGSGRSSSKRARAASSCSEVVVSKRVTRPSASCSETAIQGESKAPPFAVADPATDPEQPALRRRRRDRCEPRRRARARRDARSESTYAAAPRIGSQPSCRWSFTSRPGAYCARHRLPVASLEGTHERLHRLPHARVGRGLAGRVARVELGVGGVEVVRVEQDPERALAGLVHLDDRERSRSRSVRRDRC